MADSLLEYYRALLQLRDAYPGLVSGSFSAAPSTDHSVLLISSEAGGFSAVTAVNYSDQVQSVSAVTSLPNTTYTGVFETTDQVMSTASSTLEFPVPPRAVVVYVNEP